MMYDILKNLILIELTNVKPENIERLLIDNGLNDELCHEKLAEMKAKGVDKLYVDSKTFETVASVFSDNPLKVMWERTFLVQILDMKPIKFEGQKSKPKNVGSAKLDVDVILDKINESGIDSLTKEEKEYLENNN
jgi:hypothetical protein